MDVEAIYEHYRELLRQHNPVIGRVLKTDCFNESVGDFRDLGGILDLERTSYVEINPELVDKCRQLYSDGDFRVGDIRQLPFEDLTFNTVFDLSTIDHVPPSDVGTVLDEYHRVLKLGGKLVMVVWCAEERREEPIDWDGPQYFFYEPDIAMAAMGFSLMHKEMIHQGDGIYLLELILRKT